MALGMTSNRNGLQSASSSPRIVQGGQGTSLSATHVPSSYRSPPIASRGFDHEPSSLLPSRAAPAPPLASSSRRESLGLGGSSSRSTSKSTNNSPNPNRFSGPISAPLNLVSSGHPIPPPRPSRAGTLPFAEGSAPHNGIPPHTANRAVGASSAYAVNPSPPPLLHQPFSAPTNPYAMQSMEKSLDTNVGLGVGMPMAVMEPRDKELPDKPGGRSRSGTGKSSTRDKKSVFGVLTGM